jgi:glycosyltransferase involved in cell wall biosynthesis
MEILFIIPGDINLPTGGYRYDREILRQWKAAGIAVKLVSLEGDFPFPDETDRAKALARVPELTGDIAVIDGLAGGAMPEFASALSRKMPVIALIHHPLCLEKGLTDRLANQLKISEKSGLSHCSGVITPSPATARAVREIFAFDEKRIHTVLPGVERSNPARGSTDGTPNLLCIGSVIERKGHRYLIEALAKLRHLDWRLDCIGLITSDNSLFTELDARIRDLELADRIVFHGPVDTEEIEKAYLSADIFVLPSLHEGYGMVYAEAIVRGIPVIGTTAGAIPETVPDVCGLLVEPGNTDELAAAMERMITDHDLRSRYSQNCLLAGPGFPTWQGSATLFARLLEGLS